MQASFISSSQLPSNSAPGLLLTEFLAYTVQEELLAI